MKIRDMIPLHAAFAAAGIAALLSLAGCGGGGSAEQGKIQVDLRPLLAQMNQPAPASASAPSVRPLNVVPGASQTTTPVQSLVIGAIAIGFTDTPLGPDTTYTSSLQDQIKTAVENSVKYITVVDLPVSSPFIEFIAPPQASTHWQVGVIGTRDTIGVLSDLNNNSPIYVGFNTDANGNPVFLSTATVSSTPVDIQMIRACIVSGTPPLGCAQYYADRTAAVTSGVEIVGINLNGSPVSPSGGYTYPIVVRQSGTPGGACTPVQPCDPATAAGVMLNNIPGLSTASSARVDTTHQLSAGQSSQCASDTTASSLKTDCGVQSFTTTF